ncbi:QcrA and Rieske domain-containing protein [Mucilaginibacter ginsenosidivorans]|uniref:Rieske 2Fe-2S domain-containing protein n=1 Tax=Mucilaginibacter ginsenosidivorans TaxID=398053 RepID=A0A5B8UWL0_9SPHI|nr:Rieske 2Fe-2S domain-containing protein [Mucilaginibacter ginsenosidivorans]QEC63302.1 Rieske 2Fe-2S domain-containing protein [Mucilaginibacter ginsenosidivorans]
MERSEFLAKFGITMAAVCAGCSLAGCGSKSSDPNPGGVNIGGATPPPTTGSGNLFTVDLSSQLTSIGSSKTQSGVIIVRIADGNDPSSFTAVQVACTHQGTAINYNNGQQRFICPAHGSEFSKSGAVLVGPASTSLHQYTVSVDGTTLTVSA